MYIYNEISIYISFQFINIDYILRPPTLSELTPIILNMALTQLSSKVSIYCFLFYVFFGFDTSKHIDEINKFYYDRELALFLVFSPYFLNLSPFILLFL